MGSQCKKRVNIMSEKILVVDDEIKLLDVIKEYLSKEGYDVFLSFNGQEALNLFSAIDPDLIVLDLMLPDLSGEEICQKIREKSEVPILILSAKSSEQERINGLALGADDYLTKPFSPKELVMRVKAILRRVKGNKKESTVFSFNNGDLKVNVDQHVVTKKNQEVRLTPNEYNIFLALLQNPGRVFSRTQLINIALGYDFVGYERTIDTHIKNIRQKIEDDYKAPRYIITVFGVGYKFQGDNQ